MIPLLEIKLEDTDLNLSEDGWKGVPPEQEGMYEFCCGETDYEVELVKVEIIGGRLSCQLDGQTLSVREWHDGLTCPAWRTPR